MSADVFGEVSVEDLLLVHSIIQRIHEQTFQSAWPALDEKDPKYKPENNVMAPRLPYAKEVLLKCLVVLSENIKRKTNMLGDLKRFGGTDED